MESKQATGKQPDWFVRPRMESLPRMQHQDPQRSSQRQDYAYRIAATVTALFFLLTWLSA